MTIVPRHVVRSSTVGRQPIETLRAESACGKRAAMVRSDRRRRSP